MIYITFLTGRNFPDFFKSPQPRPPALTHSKPQEVTSTLKEKPAASQGEASIRKPIAVIPNQKRIEDINSLISKQISKEPGKLNVAMVIKAHKTEGGLSPESILYNNIKADGINIVLNLFNEELFKSKGYFDEIYNGNIELLNHTNALLNIDYLVLGNLHYSFTKKFQIDKDLISCNINLQYKTISKKGGLANSGTISVTGPGFSEDSSLERGLEILAEKYSDRILKPPL